MLDQFYENIIETSLANNKNIVANDFARLTSIASENIQKFGFPTNSTENWRTSECSQIYSQKYKKIEMDDKLIHPKQWWEKGFEFSDRIIIFNGRFSPEANFIQKENYSFQNYSPFQRSGSFSYSDLLINSYERRNTFIDLNLLTSEFIYVLEVSKDIDSEKPILLSHLIDETVGDISLSSRIIVKVKKGITANLVEGFSSQSRSGYLYNSAIHFLLEDGAVMNFTRIQDNGINARQMDNIFVEQSRDSKFNYNYIDSGSFYSHSSLYANLNDTGAECIINGLYLGKNKQFHGFRSKINHAKPNCHSNESIKGIVNDESRGMFQGLIYVAQGADKTAAYQQHDALLLSQKSFSTSQPQLEIFNDDVACSHGSTVGQLNDKELFYLMSRGIDRKSAVNILTSAFAQSVIDGFSSAKLKPVLHQYCHNFFEGGE